MIDATVPTGNFEPGATTTIAGTVSDALSGVFTLMAANATAVARLVVATEAALNGNPPYAYSPMLAILAYKLTGQPLYLTYAIARVDDFVTEFEQSIATGTYPAIAGDSYLEIGWYLENLSLAYDHGVTELTFEQRQRWAAIADQAIFNLWHPSDAKWGGNPFPWTGWSICDPGNNYHFSFLRAIWFNPLAPNTVRYLPGIVSNAPGAHDLQTNPQLSGQGDVPYRVSEGCVWLGGCTIGQVLAHYREIYKPAAGSPLINAGDPADGAETPIGAIGPTTSNAVDRFGRIIQ